MELAERQMITFCLLKKAPLVRRENQPVKHSVVKNMFHQRAESLYYSLWDTDNENNIQKEDNYSVETVCNYPR